MAVFGAGWIVVAAIAELVLSYRPLGSQLPKAARVPRWDERLSSGRSYERPRRGDAAAVSAAEVLQAIEAEVFPPRPGWQCGESAFRGRCWVWL